jgi:hypothetical protein
MPPKSFRQEYLKLATVSLLCAACLALVGYLATRTMTIQHGLSSMLLGIGVSLIAGLIGAIPVGMAAGQPANKAPVAILTGTALRFLLVLLGVVLILFSGAVHRRAFIIWVVISYLVLLLVDTLVTVTSLKAAREDAE